MLREKQSVEKLRFENSKGRSPEADESRRFEDGRVAPDLELWRKAEGESTETPKEISIID
jgi:hypothetical protein